MHTNVCTSVERVTFLQFAALLGQYVSDCDTVRLSCGWYIGESRRSAGSLFLDIETENWRYGLFQRAVSGWRRRDSLQFTELEEAESSLIEAIAKTECGGVEVVQRPMRLRFGRGRSNGDLAT